MSIAEQIRQVVAGRKLNAKQRRQIAKDLGTTEKYVGKIYYENYTPENAPASSPHDTPHDADHDTEHVSSDKQSWEEQKDAATWEYKGSKSLTTLKDALDFCEVDLNKWEVDRHVFNSWDVTMRVKGKPITRTNYQVKVWFKRKKIALDLVKKEVLSEIAKYSKRVPLYDYPVRTRTNLLEICPFDLHLGCLVWGKEVGQDYDSEIAKERFGKALNGVIQQVSNLNFERILYIVGNDFFNSDKSFPYAATQKGTPQNDDGRFQKIFQTGRQMQVEAILTLSKIAPVDVLIMPGNHDAERAFYLGEVLDAFFYNNKNVNVDNRPKMFKYYQYGNTLLGFNHGDKSPEKKLPLRMAQDCPKEWATTIFREWHLGHFHHENTVRHQAAKDNEGVTIRYLRTLTATDEWHYEKSYISQKGMDSFVIDYDQGITNIIRQNLMRL